MLHAGACAALSHSIPLSQQGTPHGRKAGRTQTDTPMLPRSAPLVQEAAGPLAGAFDALVVANNKRNQVSNFTPLALLL